MKKIILKILIIFLSNNFIITNSSNFDKFKKSFEEYKYYNKKVTPFKEMQKIINCILKNNTPHSDQLTFKIFKISNIRFIIACKKRQNLKN